MRIVVKLAASMAVSARAMRHSREFPAKAIMVRLVNTTRRTGDIFDNWFTEPNPFLRRLYSRSIPRPSSSPCRGPSCLEPKRY